MDCLLQTAPDWWKSELKDIEETAKTIKRGSVSVIGKSAGGREIYLFEYGNKSTHNRKSNYSSAIGAYKPEAYKKNDRPHLMILCGVHGAEWEGIVSALNLIHIFETGKDFVGNKHTDLSTMPERAYISFVLAANPDGRARIKYQTVVGMDRISFRKEDQGIWLTGEHCEWPEVKQIHPVKDSVQKLGGYFNDDGINLMHDSFTNPMANETKVLMRTVEEIAPDLILNMHGHGGMGGGHLIASNHQFTKCYNNCFEFSIQLTQNMLNKGYSCEPIRPLQDRLATPCFNLDDALHVTCGAMVITYESDQGVLLYAGDELRLEARHEKIYEKHLILYRTADTFLQKLYQQIN